MHKTPYSQNVFCFVCDCKAIPHFSHDKLREKIIVLYVRKYTC